MIGQGQCSWKAKITQELKIRLWKEMGSNFNSHKSGTPDKLWRSFAPSFWCVVCYSCPGLQCQVTNVSLFVLFKKQDICYLFAEQQNHIFTIISGMCKGIELCFRNENLEKIHSKQIIFECVCPDPFSVQFYRYLNVCCFILTLQSK